MVAGPRGRVRRGLCPGRQPRQHRATGGGSVLLPTLPSSSARRPLFWRPSASGKRPGWRAHFRPKSRRQLRDNSREFHLESAGAGKWELFEVHLERGSHDAGKQAATELQFNNPYEPQPLQWIVRSTSKQAVDGLVLEINGKRILDLQNRSLPPGGCLKYAGGARAMICDSTWKEVAQVEVSSAAIRIESGSQQFRVSSPAREGINLKIELRTLGPASRLGPNQAAR